MIIKTNFKMSPLLNEYLALLVESGRRFVEAKPNIPSSQIMTDLEIQELAGYMLGQILDTPEIVNFYRYFSHEKQGLGKYFLGQLINYCIEDSVYNGERLLDTMKSLARYYFEDDNRMQDLLTQFRHGQMLQHQKVLAEIREQDRLDALEEAL